MAFFNLYFDQDVLISVGFGMILSTQIISKYIERERALHLKINILYIIWINTQCGIDHACGYWNTGTLRLDTI